MKFFSKFLPFLALVVAIVAVVAAMLPAKNKTPFDVEGFGRIPVVADGRLKPFDTVARTSLLRFQGRQDVYTPGTEHRAITPTEWLLDVCFRPEIAANYRTFEIVQPELLSMLKLETTDGDRGKRFSYAQIAPSLDLIIEKSRQASEKENSQRDTFDRALLALANNLAEYQNIQYSLAYPPQEISTDFLSRLIRLTDDIPLARSAARAQAARKPATAKESAALAFARDVEHDFHEMSDRAVLLPIPPVAADAPDSTHNGLWRKTGDVLLDTFSTGIIDPAALTYAGIAHAWRGQNSTAFNEIVRLYTAGLDPVFHPQLRKAKLEQTFNHAQPFYLSAVLFVLVFLLASISWLRWPKTLRQTALLLMVLAWLITTAGMITRIWLGGYAPITNLYSSALGVAWFAVTLCIVLEFIFKNAIASMAGGIIGFCALQIAHQLSLSGDTLEMMRAVLDSNFWLSTHVVAITVGYSATFLAGILAIIYIFLGIFTKGLTHETALTISRMVYGIVCFATLFSLVGTLLGGIWADQSWGRFWGWDPKENGALIIVIWNAVILHARWGKLTSQRGLMAMAVFGNIVTAWSWFGTNLLEVGLHSYGFTDKGAIWLTAFAASQVLIIALAQLPQTRWRSQIA